jgi:WD40 repeat protein
MTFFSLARASAAVRDLEHNSAALRDLNLWFRNNIELIGCRILVFYEKLPLNKVIVVDAASADPGIRHVHPIPLDENHATICKPGSAGALQYLKVRRFVDELLPVPQPGSRPAPQAPSQVLTSTFLDNVGGWKRNEINAVAWSPCSRYLAAASDDGTLRVWRPAGGDLLLTIVAHRGPVKSVCWGPRSDALASCSTDGGVATWGFPGGARHHRWDGADDWARSVAWAADGSTIAAGYANGTVRAFEPVGASEVFRQRLHDGRVRSVAIAASGHMLASGATDGLVKVVDLRTGSLLAAVAVDSLFARDASGGAQVLCLAWSPADEQIALGTVSGHLALIDTLTWRITRARKVCRDAILSLCWAAGRGGHDIVCGSADRTLSRVPVDRIDRCAGAARPAAIADPAPEHALWTHSGSVRAVACSPDGRSIASGSTDETIKVGSPYPPVELRAHPLHVRCAALSPDGRHIATGSVGRRVVLYGTRPAQLRWSYEGTSEVLVSVAAGKDERLVEKRREGLDEYIRCLSWSPDGRFIAVGGDDRVVRVLDAEHGRAAPYLLADCHDSPVRYVGWSPVGDRILSCSGHGIVVWDVFTGARQRRAGSGGEILAAAWAPAGQRFATAAADGTIVAWTSLEPVTLARTPTPITLLSWSPDGKYLLGAGLAADARVWDAVYGAEIARIPVDSAVRTVAWDTTAARCALSTDKGTVLLVSTQSWCPIAELASLPPTHRSLCLSFATAPLTDEALAPALHVSSTPLA